MKFKNKYFTFLIIFAMTLTFSIVGVNNFKDNKIVKISGKNTVSMNSSQQVKKKVAENLDISWSPIGIISDGIFKDLKINNSDLEIKKIAQTDSNLDYVTDNSKITYTIEVKNNSNFDANQIEIKDRVPNDTILVEGSITNNGIVKDGYIKWMVDVKTKQTVKVSFIVNVIKKEDGVIKNTAIVDGKSTNEVINIFKHIELKENIKAIKSSNQPSNTILKEGSQIEYTMTLTNDKGTMSKAVTITDKVPVGTTLVEGSINNNGKENSGTITWKDIVVKPNTKIELKFKVTTNVISSGVSAKINNTAIITKDGNDENTNTVENTVGKPNLEFEKISSKLNGTVKEGQNITYTINVQNTGTLSKENIEIKDTVPNGTSLKDKMSAIYTESTRTLAWNITKLEPSESTQVQFTVTVDNNLKEGFKIQNTGTVDGKETNTTINEVTFAKQQVQVIQTSETIKKKNIVMVLDLSSSMSESAGDGKTKLEAAKTAAQDFITNIYKDGDISGVNIQVLTFNNKNPIYGASYSGTKNLIFGSGLTISTNKAQAELIKTAISNIKIPKKYEEEGYGTHIYEALKLANTDITNLKSIYKDNENVVVFLGDGEPTPTDKNGFGENSQTNILNEALEIKTKAKLYTIGFKMSNNGKTLMQNVSSGTGCYFTAENSQTLLEAFSGITKSASTTSKTVNSDSGYVEFKTDGDVVFGKEYSVTQNGVTTTNTSVTIEANGVKTVYKSLVELVNSGILSYDSDTKKVRWNVKNYKEDSKLNIYFYIQ